jgi:hypothetical protein
MSVRAKHREPRRWLLWCSISDTPREDSEYLSEQQLRESILLDLVDGVRSGKIHLQLLPERKKNSKKVALGPLSGPKTP